MEWCSVGSPGDAIDCVKKIGEWIGVIHAILSVISMSAVGALLFVLRLLRDERGQHLNDARSLSDQNSQLIAALDKLHTSIAASTVENRIRNAVGAWVQFNYVRRPPDRKIISTRTATGFPQEKEPYGAIRFHCIWHWLRLFGFAPRRYLLARLRSHDVARFYIKQDSGPG